jgi:glycyl-tRNA synthetase beta chain
MAELLLELFSEEIPARMQLPMANKLKEAIEQRLKDEKLYFQKIEAYTTPRRLVISVDGMSLTQEDTVEEKRGPKVGAPEQALNGFLKSTGLTADQLQQRETDKGTFYFAIKEQRGKPTKEVLTAALEEIIPSLTWPKSMRWGTSTIRWVRPLKNILCTFGGDVLPITFGHLTANDNSQGHRFLSPDNFKVSSLKDLQKELANRYVILDTQERKKQIYAQCTALAEAKGLKLLEDDALLTEVAGLVEYPQSLLGSIDAEFMVVPEECLISSIRTHQKYFCLRDTAGNLAPFFIVVSNMKSNDGGKSIVAGNERVLRARLADAKFFWDLDHKVSLDARAEGLKRVVFHAKLGTVAEKAERIATLGKFLATSIPKADARHVERAAQLCKADLTTEMVGEFAELQGIMGRYYATHANEDEAVANAIVEHYAPQGPSDSVPTAPTSIAVALADKIDTLCGLFAAGEKPTGSKDPFALRRATLGIIRIILENKLSLDLRTVIDQALKAYPKEIFKRAEKGDKKSLLGKTKAIKSGDVTDEIISFIEDRLKALLKGEKVKHDLINAVLANGDQDNLLRAVQRIAALDKLLATDEGANVLAAYNRATNMVRIEEKKDKTTYSGNPSRNTLEQPEEIALFDAIEKIKPSIKKALASHRYAQAMASVAELRTPVDAFFDKVTVNDGNQDVRKNRLKLLSGLRELLDEIADFSELEG